MSDSPVPLPPHLSLVAPPCRNDTKAPAKLSLPDAGFAAHLIAMRVQAPAFRARRRAAPSIAIAAYQEAANFPQPPSARMRRL